MKEGHICEPCAQQATSMVADLHERFDERTMIIEQIPYEVHHFCDEHNRESKITKGPPIRNDSDIKEVRLGPLTIGLRKRKQNPFYDERFARALAELKQAVSDLFRPLVAWLEKKLK